MGLFEGLFQTRVPLGESIFKSAIAEKNNGAAAVC